MTASDVDEMDRLSRTLFGLTRPILAPLVGEDTHRKVYSLGGAALGWEHPTAAFAVQLVAMCTAAAGSVVLSELLFGSMALFTYPIMVVMVFLVWYAVSIPMAILDPGELDVEDAEDDGNGDDEDGPDDGSATEKPLESNEWART